MTASGPILRLLHEQVLARVHPHERDPWLRHLMARARRFNEEEDDLPSAVGLWTETARASVGERRDSVVPIMMSVAHQRGAGTGPWGYRDVDGAIRLHEAVLSLHVSDDQDARVVKTMMAVANGLTDVSRDMDVEAAIRVWKAIARQGRPDDTHRALLAMMDVANRLTQTAGSRARFRLEPALLLWRAVWDIGGPDDRDRLIKTMMAVASRISDLEQPSRDFDAATRIWGTVYEIVRGNAESELHTTRVVMDVANAVSNVDDRRLWDPGLAVRLWTFLATDPSPAEARVRARRTMWAVANRLVTPNVTDEDLRAALDAWYACWRTAASDPERSRVQKSVLDACRPHAGRVPLDPAWEAAFREPIEAGLMYYADRFEDVLALRSIDPAVRALRADALRKLRRWDAALAEADAVLPSLGETWFEADARVSLCCCRGYCLLERSKAGSGEASASIAAFEEAIRLAGASGVPVPPRAWSGLGYVYRLLGRTADADDAFARALAVDADNRKALDALREL